MKKAVEIIGRIKRDCDYCKKDRVCLVILNKRNKIKKICKKCFDKKYGGKK